MNKPSQLSIAPFDASDYLDSEETIAEYLSAALENPDPDAFLVAVRDVAKARGISTVAANAGLGRESLYKALKTGGHNHVLIQYGVYLLLWVSGLMSCHHHILMLERSIPNLSLP
jgi:probable addiction module antidote protein